MSLNRGGIADLLLLRTLLAIRQKSQEPSFWEMMDSIVVLAYPNLAFSRTLKQPFSLLELYSRFRSFILSVQTKKQRFQWTMAAALAAENHGDQWGIYINSKPEPTRNFF